VIIVKITVIILRNTFYIKCCNKTFLNSDFCFLWTQFDSFDVSDSCHVIAEHYLTRRSCDSCQNNCRKSQKHVLYQIRQKTFLNSDFCNFKAYFDSFDVSGSYHVIVEHYLARRSRDNWQNNCHNSQKYVLYKILQENVSKPWFLEF